MSPEGDSFGETVSTLKFAQRASTVELGAARLNKESREVMDLKEQIESLKRQLAEKEPHSAQQVNKLESKSPLQRQKTAAVMTVERTPPRPRRLSMENKYPPPPKSPMGSNSTSKNRQLKPADVRLPKTPEPQVSIRNEIVISSEIRTTTANGSYHQSEMKSSSHIRKSLKTIGKLINGSEKRWVKLQI